MTSTFGSYSILPLLTALFLLCVHQTWAELKCSCNEDQEDPALREMTYDIGDGPQTIKVYVEPDVNSMYNGNPPASAKVVPLFEGFSVKFINMSNKRVQMAWVGGDKPTPMAILKPFHSGGTASFPGHEFVLIDPENHDTIYHRTTIEDWPDNLKVYDPIRNDPEALAQWTEEEREQYEHLRRTLDFSKQYEAFTGRPYLVEYLRDPPNHFIWPAEHFGQEHWVETLETHFTMMPAPSDLVPIEKEGSTRQLKESDPRLLEEYRVPGKLNMTMKVLSVAPRVFEIESFLSPVEIQHILEIAGAAELGHSTVGNGKQDLEGTAAAAKNVRSDTRTSTNTWVNRARTPIIDAVYRRSADLMRMDEALLRNRGSDEMEHFSSKITIAEDLQLVHYDPGQKYTAHHDFGYRDLKTPGQKARFATLLLYLNDEGLEGGETSFPRWRNAETFHKLRVKPEAGKAVLFYSQLCDGNFDDFSQHAAEKPLAGDKWLINLWTWAPYKDELIV